MDWVLITGVAGGIGAATAAAFRDAGWRVLGTDRIAPDQSVASDEVIVADLADPAAVDSLFDPNLRGGETLRAVVNNAATQLIQPIVATDVADWDRVMATNVRAPFLAIKRAATELPSGGAIVNIASVHAHATSAGMAAYVTSKGALVSLTRAAACELAEHGIRVNAVCPGAVDTDMLRAGLTRSSSSESEALEALTVRHPLGRVARPDDVARAVLFLADSAQSGFITGQTLVVDGGALARLSTE